MSIYVALLRGINVGGHNKIAMADLRRMFDSIGLNRVQTYIQSGNVLFESAYDEEKLCSLIEQGIRETFGYSISVILRSAKQLRAVAERLPFSEEALVAATAASEFETLYIAFLGGIPSEESVAKVMSYRLAGEDVQVIGRELYFLSARSIRDSKLMNHIQKLDVPATARNWKTLNKLIELTDAMQH
ncbi:MAG: DUF1697 domain-containing protein [Candidatus Cohnella colombiensis]|uniref:DUF1697 domain-containing protein n=1 Tax=Candidatus Cohnella colombiensis TaxID=3121368 RepID=A0AA95EX78_9BACL|nr:MAG: DUF1697 domain-containing protein [Cohnella sp.]